jgi:hypothetical protein
MGMRFRIDVNTLGGKLSFEKEDPVDALQVAKGTNLGVAITDGETSKTYSVEEFEAHFLAGGKAEV